VTGSGGTGWSQREGAPGGVSSPRGCSQPANRRQAHRPPAALGWPAARGAGEIGQQGGGVRVRRIGEG
jgi:hypothetical protein